MKFWKSIIGILFALSISGEVYADEQLEKARDAVQSLIGSQITLDSFEASIVPGVYEATLSNSLYYVYVVGDYVVIGDAYNVSRGVSLKEEKLQAKISELVNSADTNKMIVFSAQQTKRHVTVFTDIDCGYCRRFHREVPALTEAGLEVRYMAFPRSGIGSSSYDKIVTVWCSDDQQTAMTQAKSGEKLPPLTCENPVADHFMAGSQAGVNGTPTLVMDDGTLIGGFLPAEALLTRIGLKSN